MSGDLFFPNSYRHLAQGNPAFIKEEMTDPSLHYYGITYNHNAADDEAQWQVYRVAVKDGVATTRYANFGEFNAKWSDRATYFPAGENETPDFEARGMDVTTSAQLIDTSILGGVLYVVIQSDIFNTKPIYVGKSNVATSGALRGTQLNNGQSTTYPVKDNIYVIADDNAQKCIYTLFNWSPGAGDGLSSS